MSFEEVGNQFAQHYYTTFCSDRSQLVGLYRDSSLVTWSGEQLSGVGAITEKLANLTFQTAQFKPEDIDCHPSLSGGVLLVVNGECMLDQERHGLKFNDVFHLAQDQGNWFISNQMFRIVGGN